MDNLNKLIDNEEKVFEITTKSPGKVLLCGGYLIINPKYRGLVVCTKTYFDTKGRLEIFRNSIDSEKTQSIILFEVYSRNFKQLFYYKFILSILSEENENLNLEISFERLVKDDFENLLNGNDKIIKDINNKNNEFDDNFIINSIKSSIYYLILHEIKYIGFDKFLAFIKNKTMYIKIDLEADFRFYGYDKSLEQSNITKNIKTGLGSSSALICSLTSNIILNFFKYFNNIEIKSSFNQYENHTKLCVLLAAINANNQAQNKVINTIDKLIKDRLRF